MAATDLGKVGIVMKGNYNSANTYEVLDAVSYNNGLYIAKQAVPANTLPTNTTYWQAAITPQLVLVEDTTGDTINVEKNITNSYVNSNRFIYLGNVARNGNSLWYSNSADISILTTTNTGIRVKVTSNGFLSQPIKIIGYIIP